MASAWGTSWGTAWGNSWGVLAAGDAVSVSVPVAALTVSALRPCVNGYWRTADETDVTADETSLTTDTVCSPFANVGLLPVAMTVAALAPAIETAAVVTSPSCRILVFPRSPYIGELPPGVDHPNVASATRAYRVASATYAYTLRRAA